MRTYINMMHVILGNQVDKIDRCQCSASLVDLQNIQNRSCATIANCTRFTNIWMIFRFRVSLSCLHGFTKLRPLTALHFPSRIYHTHIYPLLMEHPSYLQRMHNYYTLYIYFLYTLKYSCDSIVIMFCGHLVCFNVVPFKF